MNLHTEEVKSGDRFAFGKNWSRFLKVLDDNRIEEAENSLKTMLQVDSLEGKTFLDAGSGSGLFSLAAKRLGAKVTSFDYDPHSVACTGELKRRYFQDDPLWTVEEGSVLDQEYLAGLGRFDVVYSWGVLHHTGSMWQALDNVVPLVAKPGKLFVAIYNDQGGKSTRWKRIKKIYNSLPKPLRLPYGVLIMGSREIWFFILHVFSFKPFSYISSWIEYKKSRGMSRWHDLIDWVGGYPFEVAKPEDIFQFYHEKGFALEKLVTCGGGLGCNEFVFKAD